MSRCFSAVRRSAMQDGPSSELQPPPSLYTPLPSLYTSAPVVASLVTETCGWAPGAVRKGVTSRSVAAWFISRYDGEGRAASLSCDGESAVAAAESGDSTATKRSAAIRTSCGGRNAAPTEVLLLVL